MVEVQHWVTPAAYGRIAETVNGKCFTSDLSVYEFASVHQAGFEPLGLVMGSSVYHIGLQVAKWSQSMELTVLTQAMYNGREYAIERMVTEAEQLGADGIVGMDLALHMHEGGHEMMEFLAVGTAVRSIQNPGAYRTPAGRPFSSDLSGYDFLRMLSLGFVPTSFVFGACVYHVAHQSLLQSVRQTGQNVEMPQYTQAIYEARELAVARMQDEGERSGGTGIVGVQGKHATHVWGEHAVEFLSVGTAVRPLPEELPRPEITAASRALMF